MPKTAIKQGRTQVRVSHGGQVSIPKPFREAMRLKQGTILEVEAVHGQLIFTPKALTDWEGQQAYAEAKAEEKAGRLSGPFTAKQAEAHLKRLVAKAPKKVSKPRRKK